MDANEIKIIRKRRLGNTSISDFFKPKVCNTDGILYISIEDRTPLIIFEILPLFSLLANGRKLMAWPGVVFVVVVVGVVNNFFPASSPQKLLHRFL